MDNRQHEEEWHNGLCSHCCGGDCGTCMASWFCACFLFGRLSSRAKNFPRTESADIEYANGSCAIWYLAGCVGFHWVPQMLRRQEIRQQFGIRGDGCMDCLAAYFCAPCSLAQMETELKDRAERAKAAGPQQGYPVQAQGMVYGQQQQQQQQQYPHQPQQQPQYQHPQGQPQQPMMSEKAQYEHPPAQAHAQQPQQPTVSEKPQAGEQQY